MQRILPSITRLLSVLVASAAAVASGSTAAEGSGDSERAWAHVVEATGFVDNVSICTWAVCGDPESDYYRAFQQRGIRLVDLEAMDLPQRPGPGWWFIDGVFVRDSFERNVSVRADILSVHLSWSTGGLGTDSGGVTFTVDVAPTGQRFTVNDTRLTIDPLEAGVAHTFTVTAIRADGSTVTGPVVSATPEADPDPDCTDHRVARECRSATNWAHVVEATGLVANVSVCTAAVCGDPSSAYVQDFAARGIILVELTGPGGIGWRYVDGTFVDVRPVEEPDLGAGGAPGRDPDERTWAVVEDGTGMVLNAIVWDGVSPYDPGPGVTLVELDGRAGIGWQYVDGTFVDVRPVEDVLVEATDAPEVRSSPQGTDVATLGVRAALPPLPEGLEWGVGGLPSVDALDVDPTRSD